jgi:putative SOS response-associated peptidase YedK
VFRTANTAFGAYSIYETVRSFKNPFRAKAITEPVKEYKTRSEAIIGKKHPIIRKMLSVQWYYNISQMIWVLVMLWLALPFGKHFLANGRIAAKPHWTTYKTKRDFTRK